MTGSSASMNQRVPVTRPGSVLEIEPWERNRSIRVAMLGVSTVGAAMSILLNRFDRGLEHAKYSA